MNFSVYWQHADAVSKTLYFVLLAMSIATWTVFILRILGTRQLKQVAQDHLAQALKALKAKLAPLSFDQRKAVAEQALLRQISAEKANAEKGVSVLGTIASLAPFVGLFGTVWGIFHALVAVGKSGQAGLAQVATPVGEALIMTGLGLAVAIPAVLAYNICVRFNRTLSNELQDQAHGLLIDTMLQQDSSTQKVESESTSKGLVGGQALMAFQLGEDNDSGMNEMNLIPLIDIMLVLMIIFLVTATVANPSIPLTLPKTTAEVIAPPPEAITISINQNGDVAWNDKVITLDELAKRFDEEGQKPVKPAVQLRADKESRYDTVAQVMSRASEAGLNDLAFMSDN